ncbi:hypothetical protein [Marisediminicola sp. LYQ134]|uniref:hypothetical protein n=1 Tax=unclassified Marisediminicola TaxID=2618316 RepID=UPI00398359EE
MGRAAAFMMGVILGSHGAVGLFVHDTHLLGIFNVDPFADATYLILAAMLLWVGLTDSSTLALRAVHGITAVALIGLGLLGLIDDTVFGLLPTGLTLMDFFVFFALGAVSVVSALLPRVSEPLLNSGVPLN